ncbi:LLM class F420-dependent oxidoreductase [Streptomyces sp. NPDC088387]|uniref:LLM class F420-dependent oxidoreductase n=1 Tax=Streptomyces sp. NPDC088387 TaxID=3365859 RepID=UPI003815EF72
MRLRIFTEPGQGASYVEQLAMARAAEELGYNGFFRSDHYLKVGTVDGLPGPTDAWVTLAGLARETSRIRLGSLVSPVTFRHPGPLAIQVAQVDQMSGGRIELGIGAGWYEREHTAYGIPYPQRRFGLLEEQLEIITGLWRTEVGGSYSFKGDHYELADCPALPKPLQWPGPPIIMGGSGQPRSQRLAVKHASEYNLAYGFNTLNELRATMGRLQTASQESGRDPASMNYSVTRTVFCGRNDSQTAQRAAMIDTIPILSDTVISGSPAQLADSIAQFGEVGIQTVYLRMLDLHDLDHLELIAAEVMPQI